MKQKIEHTPEVSRRTLFGIALGLGAGALTSCGRDRSAGPDHRELGSEKVRLFLEIADAETKGTLEKIGTRSFEPNDDNERASANGSFEMMSVEGNLVVVNYKTYKEQGLITVSRTSADTERFFMHEVTYQVGTSPAEEPTHMESSALTGLQVKRMIESTDSIVMTARQQGEAPYGGVRPRAWVIHREQQGDEPGSAVIIRPNDVPVSEKENPREFKAALEVMKRDLAQNKKYIY